MPTRTFSFPTVSEIRPDPARAAAQDEPRAAAAGAPAAPEARAAAPNARDDSPSR